MAPTPPPLRVGSLVEVEVEREGEISWRSATVSALLPAGRFACVVDDDLDFVEEYGAADEATEWRRGAGGVTRVVGGREGAYLVETIGHLPYTHLRWIDAHAVADAAPAAVGEYERRVAPAPPAAPAASVARCGGGAEVAAGVDDLVRAFHPVLMRDYQRDGIEWLLKSRLANRSVCVLSN